MKKMFPSFWLCLVLLALGCGKPELERPVEVFPVSGHITFGGKPVANADVTFLMKKRNAAPSVAQTRKATIA